MKKKNWIVLILLLAIVCVIVIGGVSNRDTVRMQICDECEGAGTVTVADYSTGEEAEFVCATCEGTGEVPSSPIIKGRDNKSTEFFKNKKLQSPISPMVLFSQKITGVVYTEGGKEVLIGASVIEVGSTNGIITDIDGEYSIGISKADKKILQASYLGYETKQE